MNDYIILVPFVCIGLLIAMIGIYHYFDRPNLIARLEHICMDTCTKFAYSFWRLDDNYNCWCLKQNNEPINIGKVD